MSSTEDWNIIGTANLKEEVKEEVKEEKVETIYLILHNGHPYGYYTHEEDTERQLDSVKEYIRAQHAFDFSKDYYWVDCTQNNEYEEDDVVVKMKLVSNMKNILVKYDYTEDSLEIIKTHLLN